MGQPSTACTDWRWEYDDGDGGSHIENAHTNLSSPSSWLDTNICWRALLYNSGDKVETDGYRLEYSINAGVDWVAVTTSSSYVRSASSGNFTDGDSTSQELGAGTFDEGYWDDTGSIASYTLTNGQESEHEFCFQFRSADCSGQTVLVRIAFDDGADLDGYTYSNPSLIFPGGLSQANFRVRSGDDQLLNADAGWAGALNANVSIAKGVTFRVRFEVEESNGTSESHQYKLQYNWSGDPGWNNLLVNTAENGSTPITYEPSTQYTNGAATTNTLSGSSETFTAGDGVEDAELTGTIALQSQHTECEWCLLIQNFFGTLATSIYQVAINDTIQLRVVESDGTVLDSYDNSLTITVLGNDYYIGGCSPEAVHNWGPFIDANGNIYTVIEGFSDGDTWFGVIKSTDGGKTWAEMDGSNRPAKGDLESLDIFQDADNETLHIVHDATSAASGEMYHTFYTSDHATLGDTWGLTNNKIVSSQAKTDHSMSVVARSDGTVVAFWRGTDGSSYERIYYDIRSGGSWGGTPILLDNTATTHFSAVRAVLGKSDDIEIFYKDSSNDVIYHKTLNSSDVLSGRESVMTDAKSGGTDYQDAMTSAVHYLDGTDSVAIIGVLDDSDSYVYTIRVVNGGTPDTREQASDYTVLNSPGATGSEQPVADLAVDESTKTVYFLYADLTTQDIWRDVDVDDGGWGTDEEELDGVTIDWLRCRVITHSAGNGGKKVLAYLYDNGSDGFSGKIWYGEYELVTDVSVPLDLLAFKGMPLDLSVTGGPASVTLGLLSFQGQARDIVVSATLQVLLDLLSGRGQAKDLSVLPGSAQVALDLLGSSGEALGLSVLPGAVSTALDLLAGTSSPLDIGVQPGAVSVPLDLLVTPAQAKTLNVTPGPVSVALDLLTIASQAKILEDVSTSIQVALSLLQAMAEARGLAVTPGPASITLDLLAAKAEALGIGVEAGIQILLDLLKISTEAKGLTVMPGPVTTTLDLLAGQAEVLGLVVTPGLMSIALDLLSGRSQVPNLAVTPGPVSTTLDLLAGQSQALGIDVQAGIQILLNLLKVATEARGLTVTPGPASTALDLLAGQAEALGLAVAPGGISTALDLLQIRSAALDATIAGGPVSINLALLGAISQAKDLGVAGGPVSIALNLLQAKAMVRDINVLIGITVSLQILAAQAQALSLAVTPGPASVTLDLLAGQAQALGISVQAATQVLLNLLKIATEAKGIAVAPGGVSTQLDLLALQSQALGLSVLPGPASVQLDLLASHAKVLGVGIQTGVVVLLNLLAAASKHYSLAVAPGPVSVNLDLLPAASQVKTLNVELLTRVLLSILGARGTAPSLAVVPGNVSVTLDLLAAALQARGINVTSAAVTGLLLSMIVTMQREQSFDVKFAEELLGMKVEVGGENV